MSRNYIYEEEVRQDRPGATVVTVRVNEDGYLHLTAADRYGSTTVCLDPCQAGRVITALQHGHKISEFTSDMHLASGRVFRSEQGFPAVSALQPEDAA